MRPSKDEYFMRVASLVASRATCLRRAVGCVLVSDRGHVLATGYNGVAAGMPHCNDSGPALDKVKDAFDLGCFLAKNRDDGREYWVAMQTSRVHEKLYVDEGWLRDGLNLVKGSFPHACPGAAAPSGEKLDACEAIHAEQNALLQCRDVWAIDTAYVTCSPCVHCAKLLLNTGCARIVYGTSYDERALELWSRAGRVATQLTV